MKAIRLTAPGVTIDGKDTVYLAIGRDGVTDISVNEHGHVVVKQERNREERTVVLFPGGVMWNEWAEPMPELPHETMPPEAAGTPRRDSTQEGPRQDRRCRNSSLWRDRSPTPSSSFSRTCHQDSELTIRCCWCGRYSPD